MLLGLLIFDRGAQISRILFSNSYILTQFILILHQQHAENTSGEKDFCVFLRQIFSLWQESSRLHFHFTPLHNFPSCQNWFGTFRVNQLKNQQTIAMLLTIKKNRKELGMSRKILQRMGQKLWQTSIQQTHTECKWLFVHSHALKLAPSGHSCTSDASLSYIKLWLIWDHTLAAHANTIQWGNFVGISNAWSWLPPQRWSFLLVTSLLILLRKEKEIMSETSGTTYSVKSLLVIPFFVFDQFDYAT